MKNEVSSLTYKRTLKQLLKKYGWQSKYYRPSWKRDIDYNQMEAMETWIEFNYMMSIRNLDNYPPGTIYGHFYQNGKARKILKLHETSLNYDLFIGGN